MALWAAQTGRLPNGRGLPQRRPNESFYRLVHHSEIVVIEGASYRMKEAKERQVKRNRGRHVRARNKFPINHRPEGSCHGHENYAIKPRTGTAEEADTVMAFLDELRDTLWESYGEQITDMHRNALDENWGDTGQTELAFLMMTISTSERQVSNITCR